MQTASQTIKFDVLNRRTRAVQFTAEIECAPDAPLSWKLRLAVLWARKTGSDLRGSNLSGSDLRGSDLSGSDLSGSNLSGSDLRGSNLSGSDLRGSDLRGSDLSDSNLSGSNLSDSDLSGVPVIPHIDAAILAAIEVGKGKLDMRDWHTCETTHCRAGWAITLAGPAGAALEWAMGSAAAGAIIYAASRPGKPIPNFYDSNEGATADLLAGAAADPLPVSEA